MVENGTIQESKIRILAAEDEMMNFQLLKTYLTKEGMEVIHAKDGLEVLEKLETEDPFDLIILDIKMPRMDGIEVVKKIKPLYPDLPVLALSAYAFKNEIEKGRQAGFDGYLTKPVKKNTLIKSIKNFLDYS